LDRAFGWLREAVIEKEWSNRKYFEREAMKSVVGDDRYEEILALMEAQEAAAE